MKLRKYLTCICFLALLAVFIPAAPVNVSASPGIGFVQYKPGLHVYTPGLVDYPGDAHDWNNNTYAYIEVGYLSVGYYEVYNLTLAPGYAAPPSDMCIAFVDFCLIQLGGGGGNGWYRIFYKVGLSAAENILVDWTQTNYGSKTTVVLYDQFEPNDGTWSWDDIRDIEIRVGTKQVGGVLTSDFELYEVWVNVYYYRQPTISAEAPAGVQTTSFTVDINIADVDELYSWEFVLTYNTTYLTATDVVNGTFFDAGKSPRFWKLEVNDAIGRVWAAGSLTGDVLGQDGSGTLAVVSFTVDGWAAYNPNLLDLGKTKLNGYNYQKKRLFSMIHSVSDGYVTLPAHDVAITSVTPNATFVYEEWTVQIDVNITNEGTETESFTVYCYGNDSILLGSTTVSGLTSGSSTTAAVMWDTTGFTWANYTISAITSVITNELDTADNSKDDDMVYVKIPGDANSDGIVDVFDILKIKHHRSGPPPGPGGYNIDADINLDGSIDVFDILIAKAHLGDSV